MIVGMKLARKIRQARRDRGWSLRDAAASMGCSVTLLHKLERGERTLTATIGIPLARTLRLPEVLDALAKDAAKRALQAAGEAWKLKKAARAARGASQ